MPRIIDTRPPNVVDLGDGVSITFRVATWREQRASTARVLEEHEGVCEWPEVDWDLLMTCAESFDGFLKRPADGGEPIPCEFPDDLETVLRSLDIEDANKCLIGLKDAGAEPALRNLKSGAESPEVGVDSVVGEGGGTPSHEHGGGASDPRDQGVEKSRVGAAG